MQKLNGKKLNGATATEARSRISGIYIDVGCGNSLRWLPMTSANLAEKKETDAPKAAQAPKDEKSKTASAASQRSPEKMTEPKVEYIHLQDGLNGPW